MKREYFLKMFVLIVILFVTNSCSSKSEIKYIFLITLDTTRADHINYSLKDNDLTPHLAKLASEGIYYKNAFSLIPITLPSHANMFYSLPPHKLEVYNNGEIVKAGHNNIAQLLKKDGFSTKGVISLGVLKSEFGLNKGFDQISENFSDGFFYKDAIAVNQEVFKLLNQRGDRKGFYWIHYSDPHSPYFPPGYQGGEFKVFFNKELINQCESTDYKKIDLELDLSPGKNFLILRTKIPKIFKSNKNVRIYTTSFIDFKIRSENSNDKYEIVFPEEWNRQKEKDELIIGTPRRRGQITLINKGDKNIKLNISFIHRMIETIPSSRFLYRESVKFLDEQIGKLFNYLKRKGIYEDSVFIVVGDHGEGLGEFRKVVGHVDYLNGLFTRIPLIISGKGVDRAGEIAMPVSTLEIAPTILSFAGLKKPSYMIGESVFKLKKKKNIFLETYSPEAYHDGFSIIDYPHQLIYYPDREQEKFEFYDMEYDQNGIKSIKKEGKYIRIINGLMKKLLKLMDFRKKLNRKDNVKKLTDDQKDMLKSLGYL
ncbi:MAG: sulfatase [Acidobacteriota bacterium]